MILSACLAVSQRMALKMKWSKATQSSARAAARRFEFKKIMRMKNAANPHNNFCWFAHPVRNGRSYLATNPHSNTISNQTLFKEQTCTSLNAEL